MYQRERKKREGWGKGEGKGGRYRETERGRKYGFSETRYYVRDQYLKIFYKTHQDEKAC